MGIRHRHSSSSATSAQRVLDPASQVKVAYVEPADLSRWLATSGTFPLGVVSFGSSLPVTLQCPVIQLDLPILEGPSRCEVWSGDQPVRLYKDSGLRPRSAAICCSVPSRRSRIQAQAWTIRPKGRIGNCCVCSGNRAFHTCGEYGITFLTLMKSRMVSNGTDCSAWDGTRPWLIGCQVFQAHCRQVQPWEHKADRFKSIFLRGESRHTPRQPAPAQRLRLPQDLRPAEPVVCPCHALPV